MSLWIILLVIFQHFFFDWILQPRWVAVNKSKNYWALISHTLIIAAGFAIPAFVLFNVVWATVYLSIYAVAHAVQDRLIWQWYGRKKVENPYLDKAFWNTIAFDQFLHFVVMFSLLSMNYVVIK